LRGNGVPLRGLTNLASAETAQLLLVCADQELCTVFGCSDPRVVCRSIVFRKQAFKNWIFF